MCKPTAAYNILWPCNVPSAFPTYASSLEPLATIFAIALLPVLLLLLPAMKFALSLPRVLPRAFARNPNFAIEFAARPFTPRHVFASVFCHRCCHYLCPVGFATAHVALQIATAIAIAIAFALEVAMFVAIKFGCHQIWAPNMEEIGGRTQSWENL